MRTRALDQNHDWTFGKGRNNYRRDNDAIAQNISTRLLSFLGDCFFDQNEGIDWFEYLGTKRMLEMEVSIAAVLLNTDGVIGIVSLSTRIDKDRNVLINYRVTTVFSEITNIVSVNINAAA